MSCLTTLFSGLPMKLRVTPTDFLLKANAEPVSVQIERGILERRIKSLIDYTAVFAMYRYLNTGVFMT